MKISKSSKKPNVTASKNVKQAKAKLIEAANLLSAEISATGSVEAKEVLNDLAVVILGTDTIK